MRGQAIALKLAIAALLAALAAGLLAGHASAEHGGQAKLHDARYCEIFELKGRPPDAKVIVWNTIGLNHCPARWWDGLDTKALAAERGDTLVLLNGPRHWVIDSARGRTGKVDSFDGRQLRRVASIPIHSAADLASTPYSERTVDRVNTWHWKKGRRIFELRAPDGHDYVMQSYSQIVDPELGIGKLRKLGDRLDLPQGWRYRVKRLKQPMTLRAKGSATILQDDLKNTYQRLPRHLQRRTHAVSMRGQTKSVGSPAPGTIEDQGTVSGRPFGKGTIDLFATFAGGNRMTATFTIATERGSAFGTAKTTYTIAGGEIDFTGTAKLTGGTRRYRGIVGRKLKVHDHNTLDGQNGSITLDGSARY